MTRRGDVFLVDFHSRVGSEIQKRRPGLVVSPDECNRNLRTVIIAPMTTGGKPYPTRVPSTFDKRRGYVVLDQLVTVDKTRLLHRLGAIDGRTLTKVLDGLVTMFQA